MTEFKQPSITVIVPVYNADKYLHRCLDSILAQSFKDFELIVIDDGSTDRSLDISTLYSEKDARVNIHHKSNEGISATRQLGLRLAHGEFIQYVDADDWIEENMLEEMHNAAVRSKADVTVCRFFVESEKGTTEYKINFKDRESFLKMIISSEWAVVWRMLFRAEFYKMHQISFPENVNGGEDYVFCVKNMLLATHIEFIDKPLYHYFKGNIFSIINSAGLRNAMHQIEATRIVEIFLIENKIKQFYQELLLRKHRSRDDLLSLDFEKWKTTFPECSYDHKRINTSSLKDRFVAWVDRNHFNKMIKIYLTIKRTKTRFFSAIQITNSSRFNSDS